jgi:uncharacterized protein YggU (UPF0235/DUF167 family)
MKESIPIVKERMLQIWVQPRACRDEILGYRDQVLLLRVTALPVEAALSPAKVQANAILGNVNSFLN